MRTRIQGLVIAVAVVGLAVGAAFAQETTYEVRNAEVVSVDGNYLTVLGQQGVRQFQVPDDFLFDLDGKKLTVHQLQPGMKLSATIRTTKVPVDMVTTEVREAEVVQTMGTSVVLRGSDGKLRRFNTTQKEMEKRGIIIYKDGKQVSPFELRKGDKITATIVTNTEPQIMTEQEVASVMVADAPKPPAPAPAPAPAPRATTPAPAPAPAPAPPRAAEPAPTYLPKTGSLLPTIGLAGLVLIGIGLVLTLARRYW